MTSDGQNAVPEVKPRRNPAPNTNGHRALLAKVFADNRAETSARSNGAVYDSQ